MYDHDVERILDAARNSTTDRWVLNNIDNIGWAHDTCEPGYDPGNGMFFADWNKRRTGDDTMARLHDILETLGYSCHWYDEWSTCGDCGKAFRTQADCWTWQPSFVIMNECELVCLDCIEDDPEPYLDQCARNGEAMNLARLWPSDHGWYLPSDEDEDAIDTFKPGMYRWSDNDYEKHVQAYRDKYGDDNVLVEVVEPRQFDATIRVWLRKEDDDDDD